MLRDFSFSVNMRCCFCSPLTYHSPLSHECCPLYLEPSSTLGPLRVSQQRELLLPGSREHRNAFLNGLPQLHCPAP